MNIIASIDGYWFQKIKNGEKTIEVRKTVPKANRSELFDSIKDRIYWYNTKTRIIEGRSIFIEAKKYSYDEVKQENIPQGHCLTNEYIKDYMNYGENRYVYFWSLGEFEPLELELPEDKMPPQSWCYENTIFPKGATLGEKQ